MKTNASSIELLEARIAAATFTVTTLADSGAGSLREAIGMADTQAGADKIVFKAGLHGTIPLGSELFVDGSAHPGDTLSIVGPGKNRILLDGLGTHRIMRINDGSFATDSPVSISGLTFIHGNAGTGVGGAIFSGESLTLKKSTVSGNVAASAGGVAVLASGTSGSSAKVINCAITGNQTTDADYGYGGGLDLFVSKSIVISGSRVTGNTANYGGGIYAEVLGADAGSGIVIDKTIVAGNRAIGTFFGNGYGGGLNIQDGNASEASQVKITNSMFIGNFAGIESTAPGIPSGGGIFAGPGNFIIQNTRMLDNHADYQGGALASDKFNSITIQASLLRDNEVTADLCEGGAVGLNGVGRAKISGCTIAGNQSAYVGGGVFSGNGIATTISSSKFIGNTAKNTGGAITLVGSGPGHTSSVMIVASQFVENFAGFGAAIFMSDFGPFTMMDSKVSGNYARAGGGMYLRGNSSISISGTVVAGNVASEGEGGGADLAGTGSLTISGGAFKGNTATGGPFFDGDGGGLLIKGSLAGSITGVKIIGNFAAHAGGGIFNKSSGLVTLGPGNVIKGNLAPTDPDTSGV